jgi:hypothetical protein
MSDRRGMARYAVRFSGTLSPETVAALPKTIQRNPSARHVFEKQLPGPATTLVLLAASESDAIRRVHEALPAHVELNDAEATSMITLPGEG